jgi:uncharacterized protein YodC (DUF2158 family)
MADFKKGDLVELKSGGPIMTVGEVGDYSGYGGGPSDGVKCIWFERGQKEQDVFDSAVLKRHDDGSGGGGFQQVPIVRA